MALQNDDPIQSEEQHNLQKSHKVGDSTSNPITQSQEQATTDTIERTTHANYQGSGKAPVGRQIKSAPPDKD